MGSSSKADYDWTKVYTLEDLRLWQRPEPSLAVIGQPIGHSRSPRMHNAALASLASATPALAAWRYFKFEIDPARLGEALALFHRCRFPGLNLTLPHKVLACEHAVRLEGIADAVGAVNTLVWAEDGYVGHNTDGPGFARALQEELGVSLRGADVVLLGAGGAARGIAAVALAEGCRSLRIGNRDAARLEGLLAQLREKFPEAVARIKGFSLTAPPVSLPENTVVINATALGLKPGDPSPWPASLWRTGMRAYDIVYGTGETAFLREARAAAVPCVDGLSMLCWQGALAFSLWTGETAPVPAMMQALTAA